MAIQIKEGSSKRDWLKLVGATAETAFKSLTLGKDGFSAAISPLFRIFEALRGNDSTERRTTRLILETLSYGIAKTVSSTPLLRSPVKPELLVRGFEDEPLFGEDKPSGVTLGQIYQHLRSFWDEHEEDVTLQIPARGPVKVTRHVRMIDELVFDWLNKNDEADRIRLVSGGPGSGKSTFAKHLAAVLSTQRQWRVLFVPLQRLRGSGPLEGRINEYF